MYLVSRHFDTIFKYSQTLLMTMKGFIVYPTYRVINEKAYVYLYGRLENGESFLTINHFKPYFYIRTDDVKKLEEINSEINYSVKDTKMKNFFEKKLSRVTFAQPKEMAKLREEFHKYDIFSYEADIKFVYRFYVLGFSLLAPILFLFLNFRTIISYQTDSYYFLPVLIIFYNFLLKDRKKEENIISTYVRTLINPLDILPF